jgi:putative flavoprotein involved in K+ transport
VSEHVHDVVVIGAGQSGLATAYYLRRAKLDFVMLDAEVGPGGAWRHGWETLRLFSPARWSSLPGFLMAGGPDNYPSRNEFLAYLVAYERRYNFPIERPVQVTAVRDAGDGELLAVETNRGTWLARAVISATGTWADPYVPEIPGRETFRGQQLHSADYSSPLPFAGQRVLVIGGANSGAQIYVDLLDLAHVSWVTRREPNLLPDDVDGRVLFEWATERFLAAREGRDASHIPSGGLGDVVLVSPVRLARDRGLISSTRMFERFTETGVAWPDGREEKIDAVIWCTGFGLALDYLRPLGILDADGRVALDGTRSVAEPRVWLVGYGEWTGYASATIIGVGRSAKATAEEVAAAVSRPLSS